jgi:hypothetical protein
VKLCTGGLLKSVEKIQIGLKSNKTVQIRAYIYDYFLDERYNGCLFYQGYQYCYIQFGTTVAMGTNITIHITFTCMPKVNFHIIDARVTSVCFCVCAAEPEVLRSADTSCLATTETECVRCEVRVEAEASTEHRAYVGQSYGSTPTDEINGRFSVKIMEK